MEFDTVQRDSAISQKRLADYWRERAECLEEWVCELLTKNQALRMELQQEHSQHRSPVETRLSFSLLSVDRSPFPSTRPAFRWESANLAVDADAVSCPRKECTDVRKSVV